MVLFYLIGTVRFTEAFGAWPVAFFLLTGEEPDALRRNEIGGCRYRPYCGFDKNNRKGRENKNIRACFRPRFRRIAVRVGK